jgi:methyltransferase FkbM-like protein
MKIFQQEDSLASLLAPLLVPYPKIRLGSDNDGGYVIFDHNLMQLQGAYTYGIAEDVSFENDLAKRTSQHCINYLYDHTIDSVPELTYPDRMAWFKQPGSWLYIPAQIGFNGDSEKSNMLLKMDIEGDEWDIIKRLDMKTISQFSQIVVEFHNIYDADVEAFKRLNKLFYLGHVHGNNCSEIRDGLPEVIECTYIRKDCVQYTPDVDRTQYPKESLDAPNDGSKPDYQLSYWLD